MSKARDTADLNNGIDVDASNNVGIGTSSQSNALQVRRDSTTSATNSQVMVENRTGAVGQYSLYGTRFDNGSGAGFTPVAFGSVQTAAAGRTGDFVVSVSDTDNVDLSADERMRIDSSGHALIGLTSSAGGTNGAALQVRGNTSYTDYSIALMDVSNTVAGRMHLLSSGSNSVSIDADPDQQGADSYLSFTVDASEAMRIDSSGKVIIGIEPDNTYSHGWSSIGGVQDSSRDSTAARTHYTFRNPNGSVGTIQTSGSSTSFNTSSDYRLKTDAQPMTGASARIQALNPVNFEWIVDGTRVDGFLAHEAQDIVPEAVSGTKDAMRDEEYEVTPAVLDDDGNVVTEAVMGTRSVPDYQGIDQSKLVPLLTAALQEALTEIADLKARVTALEAV